MIQFQKKHPDRATEGQIDLFYGPLVETVRDPK